MNKTICDFCKSQDSGTWSQAAGGMVPFAKIILTYADPRGEHHQRELQVCNECEVLVSVVGEKEGEGSHEFQFTFQSHDEKSSWPDVFENQLKAMKEEIRVYQERVATWVKEASVFKRNDSNLFEIVDQLQKSLKATADQVAGLEMARERIDKLLRPLMAKKK